MTFNLGLLRFSLNQSSALNPFSVLSRLHLSTLVLHCPALFVLLVVCGVLDVRWSCRRGQSETCHGMVCGTLIVNRDIGAMV